MPKRCDLIELRRDRGEMLGDRRFAERSDDEGARGAGIGHRLVGRERLRGDDEQRRRERQLGAEVSPRSAPSTLETKCSRDARRERRKRQRGHRRAEIGAADADIDDVGEGLAFGALDRAVAHGLGESGDLGAFGEHLGHHVMAVRDHRAAGEIAQRHMQRRPPFGGVDEGAGKQRARALRGRAGENEEQRERLPADPLLRKIEQKIVEIDMEIVELLRVVGEEIGDGDKTAVFAMGFERIEGRGQISGVHGRSGLGEKTTAVFITSAGESLTLRRARSQDAGLCRTRSGRTPMPMTRAGQRLSQGI